MLLLEAMARMEGYYVEGSRPNRNKNPGDIEYGNFARAHGAIDTDGRFAIFPSSAVGFNCMASLLREHYNGMTIEAALRKYAPPIENDDFVYLFNILKWTGLKATDIISDHLETPSA
jgi:hypothetical protein